MSSQFDVNHERAFKSRTGKIDDSALNGERTTQEVAYLSLRRHLRKTALLVTSVTTNQRDNSERIHRLRTETRRANAALRSFSNWLPHRKSDRLLTRLSEICKKAGNVRDLDVLQSLLEAWCGHLPKHVGHWVLKRASRIRDDSMTTLIKYLRRQLRTGFKRRTKRLTDRIRWRKAIEQPNLSEYRSKAIDQAAKRFLDHIESMTEDRQQLHLARILGRKLRYTIDLFNEFAPLPSTEDACQILAEMQEAIGVANDRVSLLRFLKDRVAECRDHSKLVALQCSVESLESSVDQQMKSLFPIVAEQGVRVRRLLSAATGSDRTPLVR